MSAVRWTRASARGSSARGAEPIGCTLVNQLEETVREVDARLSDLDRELVADASDAPLQRGCLPQGFDQTVLDAVFHVVEHFSYHTGQIVLLAKWHAGGRIRLYDNDD